MLSEEQLRVLSILASLVVFYALAVCFLGVRAIIQRVSKRQPTAAERNARRVVLGVAVVGLGCGAYARFVEPYWLEVTHVQLSSPRWHGEPCVSFRCRTFIPIPWRAWKIDCPRSCARSARISSCSLSRFGKRFEGGLYREGPTWAYINRGIGMEGGSAPRVRFFARPEVTVIDVLAQ